MGNDKRLDDLIAELELMVETGNAEIASAQQHLNATIGKWSVAIEQQRGRIAEREYTLSEIGVQSHENAPLSVLRGSQGPIVTEREKEA